MRNSGARAVAVLLLALVPAGCAEASTGAQQAPTSSAAVLEQVRAVPGVLDAVEDGDRLVVALDPGVDQAWEVITGGNGPGIPGVVQLAAPSGLAVWLHVATGQGTVEVRADGTPGSQVLVRQAQALWATPGVVGVRLADGDAARDELTVVTEADVAPVARVAWVQGAPVERVRVDGGAASMTVADAAVPAEVPAALPWPDDLAAPPCAAEDLDVALVGGDAATGHRVHVIGATNTASGRCALEGYPALTWSSRDGTELDVRTLPGSSWMAADAGPSRVVVPPGARVTSSVGWDAASTAGRSDVAARVDVVAVPGAPPVRAPLSGTLGVEGGLSTTSVDVLDGSVLHVTAWAPSTPGSTAP